MREKKIMQVKSDATKGDVPKAIGYVNLSSAPTDEVNRTIAAHKSTDLDIKMMSLHGKTHYNYLTETLIVSQKRIPVLFVIDEDDKNADIKIRNVCRMAKYSCVGKMIYMLEKSKHRPTLDQGTLKRFANHHHTIDTMKLLSAKPLNLEQLDNTVESFIMKTYDDCAGSIAGLTVALNRLKIPFEVQSAKITYEEGWISTKRDITRLGFDRVAPVSDINPCNDKQWKMKAGYTNYVDSDKGPSCIKFKSEKPKTKNIFERAWDRIKNFFEHVVYIAKNWMKMRRPQPTAPEDNLAWTIIPATVPMTANTLVFAWTSNVPDNANSDIKKANKLIANMQTSKMLAKVGPSGDKTMLNAKITDEYASYVAGVTSYNVADATITANAIAAKKNRARKFEGAILSSSLTIGYLLIAGYVLLSFALVCLIVAAYFMPSIEPEWLILLNMCLTSSTITTVIINGLIAAIELLLKPSKRTTTARTAVYVIALLLSI
jgi:hypothetical protein